jgi:MFS family permease
LLVFCRYLPFLVFGLFSGTLADRFDNRRLLIWSQAGQLATASTLAVLAFSTTRPWPFFVLAILGGVGTILDGPSRQAFTFRIVGRDDLPNAVALTSSINIAGLVVGPALGGVLIAAAGEGWCFTVNAITFLAFLLGLRLIRVRDLFPIDRDRIHLGTLAAIHEGLRYAWRSPQTRLVLMVVTLTSLAGFNFRVILPILAEKTLHSGSEVFGVLCAAFGLGSLAGGLMVASIGRASWRHLLVGSLGFNVTLLALAPIRNVTAVAVLLFIVGLSFTFWMANTQSILQLSAPDHLRGRVISLFFFAWAGVAPVSALLAGWLSHVGGTELAVGLAGLAGLTTTGIAAARARGLRREREGIRPTDPWPDSSI